MATLAPGDDSDYEYDLTAEDEDVLDAIIAGVSPPTLARAPPPWPVPHSACASASVRAGNEASAAGVAVHADASTAPSYTGDFSVRSPELELDSAAVHYHESPRARLPAPANAWGQGNSLPPAVDRTAPRSMPVVVPVLPDTTVSYPDLSRALQDARQSPFLDPPEEPERGAPAEDTRSPLKRFRSFPKKPFSVSDFAAGAWCEVQYSYVLTRLRGRRTRTAAMKGGTKVHERLEEEIYTTVRVDITKKEDGFGLKLWNIIQGLRTLRETGLTRELEVWGLLDGNVVNGIIDGLSYQNPDPEFEEELRSSQSSQNSGSTQLQAKITDFLAMGVPKDNRLIYVTDVKTRATRALPKGAQVRGTKIQLYLYHRFLSEMASGKLDYMTVFERYGLSPDEPFSDTFLAQLGALHDEIFVDASESLEISGPDVSTSPPTGQIRYQTLRQLASLLRSEVRLAFPRGAESLGQIVGVEYRLRAGLRGNGNDEAEEEEEGANSGSVIGVNVFAVDYKALDKYLADNMQWWRGERDARGVSIDEAFKCRSCEFVGDCEWRIGLDQEMLRQAKMKGQVGMQGAGTTTAGPLW